MESSAASTGVDMFTEELRISVPFGVIAAKAWGDKNAYPVLCIHGIQDNANTFDKLIPVLPTSTFYYIAIDLPGHGFSSHFPMGVALSFMEYVMVIHRVINHFGWKRCSILGHSLGGQLGLIFASLYPERITKLVLLDVWIPFVNSTSEMMQRYRDLHEGLCTMEERLASRTPPEYSEEEVLRRLTEGRPSSLSRKAAEALLHRAIVRNGSGFSFSADQRLKLRLINFVTGDQLLEIVSHVRCPLIYVRATETLQYSQGSYVYQEFSELFHKNLGKNYVYKVAEGSHDVHLEHPERVAELISDFLLPVKASL